MRTKREIEQQIRDFKAILPDEETRKKVAGDFAAELQNESWAAHLKELEEELEEACPEGGEGGAELQELCDKCGFYH